MSLEGLPQMIGQHVQAFQRFHKRVTDIVSDSMDAYHCSWTLHLPSLALSQLL
jgi:hypothetical protein